MTQVDMDTFIRELRAEPVVHADLVRVVVQTFLTAALRGPEARTPNGWRSVIQDLRYVLGSALGAGVEDRRPALEWPEDLLWPAGLEGDLAALLHEPPASSIADRTH